MTFQDFSLERLIKDFALVMETRSSLFAQIAPVVPDEIIRGYLHRYGVLGLLSTTEKARSELLAVPLLAEVWERSARKVCLLSGVRLVGDVDRGLSGVCDYVLTNSGQPYFLKAPVLVVVEAIRDSIPDGLGQCAAAMLAAHLFNEKAGKPTATQHGVVTTGSTWKFLRLTGSTLEIDADEYSIEHPERILGVLLHCCGVTNPTPLRSR